MKFPVTKTTTTFVAIVVPPTVQNSLFRLQQELRHYNFPVTWELPDKLHLTISYLGRISAEQTQAVATVLSQLSSITPSFELQLGHLDYFYQKHDHGTIWIKATEPVGYLSEFHKILVSELNRNYGFSLSQKKLLPHITLGRLKRLNKNAKMHIIHTLTEHPLPDLPSFTVDSIHLLTSRFQRQLNTTDYQIAREFKLIKSNQVNLSLI